MFLGGGVALWLLAPGDKETGCVPVLFFNVRKQVSHPYKMSANTTVLCILVINVSALHKGTKKGS